MLPWHTALGGWQDTAKYIQNLLADKTKTVAILIVDMQYNFQMEFVPREEGIIMQEQISLLEHLSSMERVHFVNVRYSDQGETLPSLMTRIKRGALVNSFLKNSGDAFKTTSVQPEGETGDLQGLIEGTLGNFLRAKAVTDIMPMGCYLSKCITATAKGAEREGFQVFIDPELNIKMTSLSVALSSEDEVLAKNMKLLTKLKSECPNLTVIQTPTPCAS